MKISLVFFLTTILFLLSPGVSHSQDIPKRPQPPRLVNDYTGLLQPGEINALENKLVSFSDSTSNQIAIVIVDSLYGYDPQSLAYQIGEKWGVGQKGFNNGVVVLLKPKKGNTRGDVFIATGYGLEPVIGDAISKRIIENEMIPEFKNNNYYQGLDKATSVLMSLAAKEFSKAKYRKKTGGYPIGALIPIIIIVIVFLLMRGSSARSSYHVGKSSLPFWATMFMLGSMGQGRQHDGSWDNFTSGGGGFGGFGGGGGFGGFGGGSFGGGGAGGSW
ncbi:MAG: TPM domain-containing protein [Bacteroidetes bacterium]|nr:TPM domain-containing protein [Bacteroidota bacterium]